MSDQSPLTQRDGNALTQAIRELTAELRALPEKIAEIYVRKDVLAPELKRVNDTLETHRRDIDGLSGWLLWAQRIVFGALLLAAVGLLIYSGTKGGK